MGDEFIHMDPLGPIDFLGRFCQLLGLDYRDERRIAELMEGIRSVDIFADNTPISIATGCIYFFVVERQRNITKKEISEKCGSSQSIITKIYHKLCEWQRDASNPSMLLKQ
jgi:transcription initiation factor TFIIIB Brf1 subunit/transcription initiation factor TFIIB